MRALFFGIAVLFCTTAHSGIIEWTNRIHTISGGTTVKIGEPEAKDSVAAELPSGAYNDTKVLNRISLGIDVHYQDYFGSSMDVAVLVKVKRWDVSMTPLSDTTFWLNVFYSPSDLLQTTALSKAEFFNAYKLVFSIEEIKVDGINKDILPANIYLQGDILIERYRELSNTAISTTLTKDDMDCNEVDDAITISWSHTPGAEEYQLEWAYINDYTNSINGEMSEVELAYDFKFNSTRITTSDNEYTISLVFDRGWLIYRLRPVGVLIASPDQFVFGPWNVSEKGVVNNISTNKVHITGMEQHEGTVNWQYAATYAEQGKKKEVISYFDGSLRNRQTVTRINSDNNIVVGETIYDYQGRPAITVLPAPVTEVVCNNDPLKGQSIHLYRDFNVNEDGDAYFWKNFDISDESALCAVSAAPMKPTTGASNYYSQDNPNKLIEQGYVPHAHGYPFAQVEYTPDNTGRIRRQGGVGPEFQIGSGHETRYLYGQPNQLELDRLFGSEVGYQSHYQKNAVIDAHGQASISYLDQQGRVVATALAGDNPENLSRISINNDVELEVDAFASGANQIGIDNRSLIFSTELLVAYKSDYLFIYDFSITPVDMDCLDSICVDCVYDLTIDLIDECGKNFAPSSLQNSMVGKFTETETGYTFHAACVSPENGEFNNSFSATLNPGTYSLNKKLTVNQQAIDSLVAIYLRSSCAKTLKDFKDIALSNIDSSGCEVTCDNCFEQLGSQEDFIASGEGNSNDYYLRVEQCQKLCNGGVSKCEIMSTLLQLDMSPGGQYGEYLNETTNQIDLSSYPLSIYNSSNLLPKSNTYWKNPILITPQGQQAIYVKENGERSKIYLTEDPLNPGVWLPEPSSSSLIQTEQDTGEKFIYPEQLAHTKDFIHLFEFSWAKSLIYYHPEYCYYEACLIYDEPIESVDAFTSTSFDQLLQQTTTMQAALDNGFVELNTNSYNLFNWFAPLGGDNTEDAIAWDPFVYYSSDFNSGSCNGNYGSELQNLFNNYKYIDGAWRSMPELAALTARCGTNYAASYPSTCYNFGQTVMGVWDMEVLDEEWVILKSLYLSEKQKLQRKLADCLAVKECESFNGCIGNDEFNPFSLISPNLFSTFWIYELLASQQPCKLSTYHLYLNKVRRFSDETDLPQQDANGVAYEVYLQTGQCPIEFTLQSLFSAMTKNGDLTAPNVNLNNYPQLSAVFQANNNFNMPGTIPLIEHQGSVSGSVLTVNWIGIPSTPISTITFTLGGTASWNDVTDIINFYVTGAFSFTAEAIVNDVANDTVYTETITGTITTALPTSCEFAPECSSNELAKKLTILLNALLIEGDITSLTPVDINPYVSATYGTFPGLTGLYIENAASVGNDLYWVALSDNLFKIYNPSGIPADGLYIQFNASIPTGFFTTVSHFGNITSIGDNSFEIEVFLTAGGSISAYGAIYREISSERIGIKSGDCGLPVPTACQTTPHKNYEGLMALLNDVLIDYDGMTSIDLFSSVEITPSIISSLPLGVLSTSSTLSPNGDTLVISAGSCDLTISVVEPHELTQLIEIKDFIVTGTPDNYNNFHDFEFTGVFDDGTSTTEVTVNGSSCISIKMCNPCITSQEYVEYEGMIQPQVQSFVEEAEEPSLINDTQLETITDYDSLKNYLFQTYLMMSPLSPCRTYDHYLSCLKDYNDNVLAMGSGSGFFLIQNTIPQYIFEENGMCNRKCDQEFCNRVNQILNGSVIISSQNALDMFLDFNNFCELNSIDAEDPCNEAYEQYLDCIAYYNSSIDANGYPVTSIYDYLTFKKFEMCYCVDHFCSRLNNVLNGLYEINSTSELNAYLSSNSCVKYTTPCEPNPISGMPSIMPELEMSNNCVEMLKNQAYFEAQIMYQNYVDSVSNALINEYITHCLGVSENFNYKYRDMLYHFTLYYYDQAGNLIKTIPPEGVEQLDISNSNDPLSLQIKADRNNNTRTVYTNHRLATRYEYNSLNQLVSQSTPDTDPMKIFEQTLPNGLHSQLITTKIQMVNENVGYLGGVINGAGAMYRTNDGGLTWTRMNDLVGADIKKAIMYSGYQGIAIGEKGTVLFTDNGGATWNLYPSIWQSTSLDVIHDLNDIAHIDLGSGNHTFIIVGENRTIIKVAITGSGPVFSMLESGISEQPPASVTSVTTDGTDFFITVNDNVENVSSVYRLPNGTSTWESENRFTTGELKDIHNYNSVGAYAAGDDGRIYKKTNVISSSERWKLVNSDLTNAVHAIRFFNEQNGVALVELQPGEKYLMRTFNGGTNWVQLSENTFNHLSISNNRSHVLAVGDNGLIEIVVPGTTTETIPVAINTTDDLTAGWIDQEPITGGVSKSHIVVASATGKLYYTGNGFVTSPVWVENDVTAVTGSDNIVDIRAERGWTSNLTIYGAVVTEAGRMYRLDKQSNSQSVNLNTITGSGTMHNGLATMGGKIFSVDKTVNQLVSVSMSASVSDYAHLANNLNVNVSAIIGVSDYIIGVGDEILVAELNGTLTEVDIQTDESLKSNPNKLFSITYQEGELICSGEDGIMYHRQSSPSPSPARWIRYNTNMNQTIYASEYYPSLGTIFAVGTNGLLVKGLVTGTNLTWHPFMTSSGIEVSSLLNGTNFYDFNINGNVLYAVGENGKVVYSPNMLSNSFSVHTTAEQRTLYGVATFGNSVLICGEGAYIETRTGTNKIVNKYILPPPIQDLHFSSASTGTYLANDFVIRTTNTGGNDWNVVYPNTLQAPTNSYRKVWTKNASERYIFGENVQYRAVSSGLASPVSITGYTVNKVFAIAQGANTNELHLVNNENIVKLNLTTHVATDLNSYLGSGAQAIALHVFGNGDYLAVGVNGLYKHYDVANTLIQSNPTELAGQYLNDVVFTDNITGVLVGANGAYFSSYHPDITPLGYLTSVSWEQKIVTGSNDPLGATNMDIYTIAFSTATDGIFGGKYMTGSFSKPCVRKIYDANSRYSSRFFYDRLGRLVLSQNARQYNGTDRKCSYTLYDALGRVVEAGEKTENSGSEPRFSSVFGTTISNFFNPSVIDDTQLSAWINASGVRNEVTTSYYDHNHISGLPTEFDTDYSTQNKRIVHVTYEEEYDGNSLTYDHATHYKYDIHGNVNTLVQDNKKMAESYPSIASQRFKRMDYAYDLVSGNVHRMSVQNGVADQWHHAFMYDADNRITNVYTNTTTPLVSINGLAQDMENELSHNSDWQNDARYFYYDHGPLARVEIGQNNLQGVDYYYNLQGWLKGVNSSVLYSNEDPGKDSDQGNGNALFAKDVFGFGLSYFQNDYAAIGGGTPLATVNSGSNAAGNSYGLYNGNIQYMQTAITNPTTRDAMPMLNAYKYDQLNRLKESRSYESGLTSNEWNPTSYNNAYFNAFTYDAMGNILTQKRHIQNGTQIEDLSYRYQNDGNGKLLRNRLYHVNDAIANNVDSTDIDDMGAFISNATHINSSNNYVYDAEGRLVKDKQEEIDTIIWTVAGKVKEIHRDLTSTKKNLIFDYDAMGNRIAKHVYDNQTLMLEKSTYYILDAQGNQLSMYDHKVNGDAVVYYLSERNIYGSSRLGTLQDTVNMYIPSTLPSYGVFGNRNYELNNHLGNVLTVINDQVYPVSSDNTTVDGYEVSISNTFDYSPFGVQLDGRTMEKMIEVCTEISDTVTVYAMNETFDSGGDWIALDYGIITYPSGDMKVATPTGKPFFAGDIGAYKAFTTSEGLNTVSYDITFNNCIILGIPTSSPRPIYIYVRDAWNTIIAGDTQTVSGSYSFTFNAPVAGTYKIQFHVAMTQVCYFNVDNVLITYDEESTETVCHDQPASYRYGFQAQEKDDEVSGSGNSYTAEFWQYDPRLGRRWNIDPVTKPHLSPYSVLSNNPIIMIDPKGDDDYYNADGSYNKGMSAKHNNNGTHNIYILSADGKSSKLLSDMPIKTESERKVVERVMNVYAKKAGVTGGVGLKYNKSEGGGKTLAFTTDKKVYVNTEGGVSDKLSNYHNLRNVMFHEKLHQDDQKSGKNFDDKTFEGLLNHTNIYVKQMKDDSFKATSEDFKAGQFGSFANYLENSLNEALKGFDEKGDTKKITDILTDFNKTTGKKYGYSISAKQTSIGGELSWDVDLKKTKK